MPGSNDILSTAGGETVVRARRTTDQTSIINGNVNTLIFNIEDYDPENAWNGTTYTVPKSGFYEFLLAARTSASGVTGACDCQLVLKIGSVFHGIQRILTSSAVGVLFISGFYYIFLNQGSLVQIQILPSYTGATSILVNGANTPTALIIRRHS